MPSRTGRTLILRHRDVNATPDVGRDPHSVIHESPKGETPEREDPFYWGGEGGNENVRIRRRGFRDTRIPTNQTLKSYFTASIGLHSSMLRSFERSGLLLERQ